MLLELVGERVFRNDMGRVLTIAPEIDLDTPCTTKHVMQVVTDRLRAVTQLLDKGLVSLKWDLHSPVAFELTALGREVAKLVSSRPK